MNTLYNIPFFSDYITVSGTVRNAIFSLGNLDPTQLTVGTSVVPSPQRRGYFYRYSSGVEWATNFRFTDMATATPASFEVWMVVVAPLSISSNYDILFF